VTEPSRDAQYAVFAESGESDWAKAAELLEDAVVHGPGDPEGIMTPEEWHGTGWDSERQPPKTTEEATTALAGRVADPEAPDAVEVDYGTVELTPEQGGPAPEKGGPE
jgi:hypothetical protein